MSQVTIKPDQLAREILKNLDDYSVESIGDIAYIMSNKEKLKNFC